MVERVLHVWTRDGLSQCIRIAHFLHDTLLLMFLCETKINPLAGFFPKPPAAGRKVKKRVYTASYRR